VQCHGGREVLVHAGLMHRIKRYASLHPPNAIAIPTRISPRLMSPRPAHHRFRSMTRSRPSPRRQSGCSAGARNDGRVSCCMHVMHKLPVVPICRTSLGLRCRANQNDSLARLAPTRGALRDRHGRRLRDAMDAVCQTTNDVTRTAKSCGPGAPMQALRSRSLPRTTVATKHGHRGDHV